MNMILLTGIQASGKSEFCKRYFYKSHVRISLDMLRMRSRQRILIDACFAAKQSFVIDNLNLIASRRKQHIDNAKKNGYEVIGFYFRSVVSESIPRNEQRTGRERIRLSAIRRARSYLEPPSITEGYDKLYYVYIKDNDFIIDEYKDDESRARLERMVV